MCSTCGCGDPNATHMHTTTDANGNVVVTVHSHGDHDLNHDHPHDHSHPHHSHDGSVSADRAVTIEEDILSRNNALAAKNRALFAANHILALNLVSSPGAGKTELLAATLEKLANDTAAYVIEGDLQTSDDADRIRATGTKAVQINTGSGCHLDAQMVEAALTALEPAANSIVFIENVGNLVCPAEFDLGEAHKVAVISVTEGEDKPLKYPDIFRASDLLLINKVDLLPYVKCDIEAIKKNALRVNPKMQIFEVSATTGTGLEKWLTWLKAQLTLASL